MIIMAISELVDQLPPETLEAMKKRGIDQLTPPQELAVKHGLLKGKNLVVAAPTASGKTLIAEMAMLRSVLWDRKKAIYIAPMRALVSEKYEEFKEAYPFLKIAMSIGDLDSADHWLDKYDIVFVSTEKFDSLIRHGVNWLGSIGCIIFDEIHMLDDSGRGPTLEVLITRLRRTSRHAQLIALSATIGNADDIAKWLGGELIESDYRPVLLEKGIVLNDRAYFEDREEALGGSNKIPEIRVAEDTVERRKQLLIFYSTKRNTEAGAEKLAPVMEKFLSAEEKAKLMEVSAKVLSALSKPTLQCEKLAKAVERGVAFHHGGLVNVQRHAVEEAFKSGALKAVCSTTTLGIGVNLPAHTVLVRDTTRYSEGEGAAKMSINEVTQLFGRAGRPKYDKIGRALLIAKSKSDIVDIYARYINADLEPVSSKLGVQSVLRTHILSFVASDFLRSAESIVDFLKGTFYGYEYANSRELGLITQDILDELLTWGFVEKKGSIYNATRMGARVSELYIDPLSAKWIIDTLPRVTDEIGNLFMITNTIEMRPYVKATEEAEERFFEYEKIMQGGISYESAEQIYYDPLKPFSTALLLNDWMSEKAEPEIVLAYGTTPGALYSKITNADWMLYAGMEIGKIMHANTAKLLEVRVRMRYGIKKELIDLTRLEQVGRVRARLMYNAGITRVADLRKPGSDEMLRLLFGKEITKRIMDQLPNID